MDGTFSLTGSRRQPSSSSVSSSSVGRLRQMADLPSPRLEGLHVMDQGVSNEPIRHHVATTAYKQFQAPDAASSSRPIPKRPPPRRCSERHPMTTESARPSTMGSTRSAKPLISGFPSLPAPPGSAPSSQQQHMSSQDTATLGKFRSFGLYFEVRLRELLREDVREPNERRLSEVLSLFDDFISAVPQFSEILSLFRSEFITSMYATSVGPGGDVLRIPYFATAQQLLRDQENLVVELGAERQETEMRDMHAEVDHLKAITTFQNNEIERLQKENSSMREEVSKLTSEIDNVTRSGQQALSQHEKQYSVLLKEVRELRVSNSTYERFQRVEGDIVKGYNHVRGLRSAALHRALDLDHCDLMTLHDSQLQLETLEARLIAEFQSDMDHKTAAELSLHRQRFVKNASLLLEEVCNIENTKRRLRLEQRSRAGLSQAAIAEVVDAQHNEGKKKMQWIQTNLMAWMEPVSETHMVPYDPKQTLHHHITVPLADMSTTKFGTQLELHTHAGLHNPPELWKTITSMEAYVMPIPPKSTHVRLRYSKPAIGWIEPFVPVDAVLSERDEKQLADGLNENAFLISTTKPSEWKEAVWSPTAESALTVQTDLDMSGTQWTHFIRLFGTNYTPNITREQPMHVLEDLTYQTFSELISKLAKSYAAAHDTTLRAVNHTQVDKAFAERMKKTDIQETLFDILEKMYVLPEVMLHVGYDTIRTVERTASQHYLMREFLHALSGYGDWGMGTTIVFCTYVLRQLWPVNTTTPNEPISDKELHNVIHKMYGTLGGGSNNILSIPKGAVDDIMADVVVFCKKAGFTFNTLRVYFTRAIVNGTEHVTKRCLDLVSAKVDQVNWNELDRADFFDAVSGLVPDSMRNVLYMRHLVAAVHLHKPSKVPMDVLGMVAAEQLWYAVAKTTIKV
eukprot:PhM_4_TR6790/c0_g1_i1/m.103303